MKTLTGIGPRNATTPQSEPIPGSSQVPNSAGGYSFPVDDWTRLERFLILGSEGGSYYANERTLTRENAAAVERCIQADGMRTVKTILAVSEAGRAPRNDQALFALAMAASIGDDLTRSFAFLNLPAIARTGTHLLHFISFAEQFRGWGQGMKKGVARWFNEKAPMDLAYQLTKYPSRDKWAMRDVLRLAHVKPSDGEYGALYQWAVGKAPETDFWTSGEPVARYMGAVEAIKHIADPKMAANLIRDAKLPREVIPTGLLTERDVWEALLESMPMTAMIRNLATMTRVGLLTPLSSAAKKITDELGNAQRLHRARVHPIQILSALLTYSQGHGVRGKGTWQPVKPIVDALDAAFYTSFGNVEPTRKRTLLALDVSGSMGAGTVAGVAGLTPRVGSAAMALVTAATEPQYEIMAFSRGFIPLNISPSMRLKDAIKAVSSLGFDGTDCAIPMTWAENSKIDVDTFVVYTDSETWAGYIQPPQALRKYRQARGINAKSVVVGMVSNGFTIADPNDGGMMDVVGFDASAPSIIADFARA